MWLSFVRVRFLSGSELSPQTPHAMWSINFILSFSFEIETVCLINVWGRIPGTAMLLKRLRLLFLPLDPIRMQGSGKNNPLVLNVSANDLQISKKKMTRKNTLKHSENWWSGREITERKSTNGRWVSPHAKCIHEFWPREIKIQHLQRPLFAFLSLHPCLLLSFTRTRTHTSKYLTDQWSQKNILLQFLACVSQLTT